MTKKYYFINDYTTKYGVVKKGDWLTGRLSSASKTPKLMFEFYEKTDKEKADSGDGTFSINEVDSKNFVTDVEPTNTDNTKEKSTNANSTETTTTKGWKSWSNTKKGLVVGGVVLGVAGIIGTIIYFKNKS
jgi:hypothetical protein